MRCTTLRLSLLVRRLLVASLALAPICAQERRVDSELETMLRRLEAMERQLDGIASQLAVEKGGAGLSDATARLAAYEAHVRMRTESPWQQPRWQFLGPTNISGRVTDVALATPRGKTYAMYVAGASGGVWKTDNEGTTWKPVFEHAASTSIGDVTIAPSNAEVVWIGTGEANILRSSMAGCGVYRSTDGGASWTHKGLAATHAIARIVIHPTNPDVVYVAASGHEWTENPERGVYRTTDGGETWRLVHHVDDRTGAIDLVMDPTEPRRIYAATWERIRKRWNDPRNEDGYDGSGIWRSEDGGDTWTAIVAGLPDARWRGRIGIDVCRSKPETLYAFVDNYAVAPGQPEGRDSYGRVTTGRINGAEVYRSDDRGGSWRKVSESNQFMLGHSGTYGWVFGQVRVDPTDPDVVYTMGLGLNVSRDGGKTFRPLRGMHGDHHALWIDPENPRYLVNGNDGGANVSYDGGATWKLFTDKLPMVQFFNVNFDMAEPFRVYGSIQDHGSRRAIVDLRRGRNRIPAQEWANAPGGEGSHHAIDPTNPDIVYSTGFYGSLSRADLGSNARASIVPKAGEGEPPLRGQWLAPFLLSPHNPRIVYHGMNALYRSWNLGDQFERISPDLTHNDEATMGDIPFHTLTALSESPLQFGVIYAGTDDGRAHVTRDGGRTWREIVQGLAPERWVSRVEASRFVPGTVYLAQNGKRHDDFAAYLWRSNDYGATWESIAAGIPCGPINVVREDPTKAEILYVGTDLGVYVTTDGAKSWQSLPTGLPTTFVSDLIVHPRDGIMVASTHGRGMYALDVRPIRGEKEEAAPEAAAPAESGRGRGRRRE